MDYQRLKIASNRVEAELIRGHLESQKIPVLLRPSSEPYGGEAYFGDTGPWEILVPPDCFYQARLIIQDLAK